MLSATAGLAVKDRRSVPKICAIKLSAPQSREWPRCSRSRSGLRSSVSANTPSALPRTRSTSQHSRRPDGSGPRKKSGASTRPSPQNIARDRRVESRKGSPAVATRCGTGSSTRYRRTSAGHSDVLGPRRFDGAVGAYRSRGLPEIIAIIKSAPPRVVRALGGFVAKYMGDGVLAYFGYPQAHEHDAEHAVRAGLEVVEAVAGSNSSGRPYKSA